MTSAIVARWLSLSVVLTTILLRQDALAEELVRCFDGTATARMMCAQDQLIWLRSGAYGVAQEDNFCRGRSTSRHRDCLPNEQGHRWAMANDCNLFSSCITFYKYFEAEVAKTCKTHGPKYSQIDYECLTRKKSDEETVIDAIFLSSHPSLDVVDEKLFLMSERYASATSGETGYCQINLPAKSGAVFRLLDLRGRTIPVSKDSCPYRLYINGAGGYKEWCAGSNFTTEEYSIERSNSESVIDVVFQRVTPKGNAAVWLLVEGKSADGSVVRGMRVTCGAGVVLQSLQDPKATTEGESAGGTGGPPRDIGPSPAHGGILISEAFGHKVYYIFKSKMSAKIPGADGIVDNLAITRDSKGSDPVLRMNFYSRDFGQQWYQDGQRIRNRVDNKCMAVNAKNQLVLVECDDSDRTQSWTVLQDFGVLENVELGEVVEVTNNMPNSGALLGVGPAKKDVLYQKFTFELAPTYFLIVSPSSGLVATLSSATERSKVVMQPESETSKDNQVFYSDKKNVIRSKINNYGIDTRSGTAVALRYMGLSKDNSWTYNSTLSKIINRDEKSSVLRVLQVKADKTLATAKSTDDPNQRFETRPVD